MKDLNKVLKDFEEIRKQFFLLKFIVNKRTRYDQLNSKEENTVEKIQEKITDIAYASPHLYPLIKLAEGWGSFGPTDELIHKLDIYKEEILLAYELNEEELIFKSDAWASKEDYKDIKFTDEEFLKGLSKSNIAGGIEVQSFPWAKENILCDLTRKIIEKTVEKGFGPNPQISKLFYKKLIEKYGTGTVNTSFSEDTFHRSMKFFCRELFLGDITIQNVFGKDRYYTPQIALSFSAATKVFHFVNVKDFYRMEKGYYRDEALQWIYN